MGIGTAGNQAHTFFFTALGQSLGVQADLFGVGLEFRLEQFQEQYASGRQHIPFGTALEPREDAPVNFGSDGLFAQDDPAAPRTPQSLLGGHGHHIGIGNRAGMQACCNKPCNVGHIYHENGANAVGNFCHAFKINYARISACTGNNQLRLSFFGNARKFVVINALGFMRNSVRDYIIIFARKY